MSDAACALCGENGDLKESHIIPSFVYKWIKNTSATGFIRMGGEPDSRAQDGLKLHLLCGKCEGVLGEYERQFANEIFYPYTNTISDSGGAEKNHKGFLYTEWLLKMVISVQWRYLVTEKGIADFSDKNKVIIDEAKQIWRQYLRGERADTGNWENHIIFLQSLIGAHGSALAKLPENINYYLLRTVDMSVTSSKSGKYLSVFTKLGPIVFWTCLKPNCARSMNTSKLKMKGILSTIQDLKDMKITEFIFVTRPKEINDLYKPSAEQREKIKNSILKNPNRALESMTFKADIADDWVRNAKKLLALSQNKIPTNKTKKGK